MENHYGLFMAYACARQSVHSGEIWSA